MKNRIIQVLVIQVILSVTSYGQSTFQNLDFESAFILPGQLPGLVSAAEAIPAWAPYIGTQGTAVLYDDPTTGQAAVNLLDAPQQAIIEGSYTVLLQGGLGPYAGAETSIRQTGQVPAGTQSIRFKADPGFGPLSVSLAGQSVPIFVVGAGSNYTLFGGDASAFAGQTVELKIGVLPSNNYWLIDSIEFSNLAVPEPGTVALLTLGGVLVGWICLRQCGGGFQPAVLYLLARPGSEAGGPVNGEPVKGSVKNDTTQRLVSFNAPRFPLVRLCGRPRLPTQHLSNSAHTLTPLEFKKLCRILASVGV